MIIMNISESDHTKRFEDNIIYIYIYIYTLHIDIEDNNIYIYIYTLHIDMII